MAARLLLFSAASASASFASFPFVSRSFHLPHHRPPLLHPPFPLPSPSLTRLPHPIRARSQNDRAPDINDEPGIVSRLQSTSLFVLSGVYVLWLFLLPYAPGDPVWAIKDDTIRMLLDLSLNFLYILPVSNWLGVHFLESPILHPTTEALFNLVMGWSILFAPLLFTDRRSNRFQGSLVLLWGVQMFLTNTVLIPYMAIRLQQMETKMNSSTQQTSAIQEIMTSPGGAKFLSVMGGVVGLVSVWWFFSGRSDESFGDVTQRYTFFLDYLENDRPGYAFIWDICLYSLFQPWLIGDNLDNIDSEKAGIVKILRFIPYFGLVAYLWTLANNPNHLTDTQTE